MAHRWIEDDPLEGDTTLAKPSEDAGGNGVASMMGLGSAVSLLLLLLAAIAMVD